MTPLDGDDWFFLVLQGALALGILVGVVNCLRPNGPSWRLSKALTEAAMLLVGGMVAYVCLTAAMGWNES